jgi:hypothetical protein
MCGLRGRGAESAQRQRGGSQRRLLPEESSTLRTKVSNALVLFDQMGAKTVFDEFWCCFRAIRTNRVTTADFAFSSADTKLGGFDRSFFSEVLLPGGIYFAFSGFCETLISSNHMRGGSAHFGQGATSPSHRSAAQWSMMGAEQVALLAHKVGFGIS